MYAVSYYSLKNGFKCLTWKNSTKLQKLYRFAQLAIAAGAIDVCIELPSGLFITLN